MRKLKEQGKVECGGRGHGAKWRNKAKTAYSRNQMLYSIEILFP